MPIELEKIQPVFFSDFLLNGKLPAETPKIGLCLKRLETKKRVQKRPALPRVVPFFYEKKLLSNKQVKKTV